jgi:glycosyltransferase involved in cell wall biosynthesis
VHEEGFVSHRYNSEKLMESSLPTTPPQFSTAELSVPEVSIIVPARNEEASLGSCLQSLTAQTGLPFEIIVVDDASTDRTREIAQSFPGVRVISPEPLPTDGTGNDRTGKDRKGKMWTGKNNALVAGANSNSKDTRAAWLLFTDADTVHLPESLARAVDEAKQERADLLSYSPEQVVVTFAERAVMPVIFAELAAQYPPHKVREQSSGIAAANGQYILVRRAAYDAVGGHAAVATEILEDVALARLFRNAGRRVHFRYGGDAVRTRMYRSWAQLREGWTKNLALLFPRAEFLAFQSLIWWSGAWSALGIAAYGTARRHFLWIGFAAVWLLLYRRIRAARFTATNNLIAIAFGPPIFAYLLLRSKKAHANGQVTWKGRNYGAGAPSGIVPAKTQAAQPLSRIESQKLRTESCPYGLSHT